MADVIQRTRDVGALTLKRLGSQNTPDFSASVWLESPDLSALEGLVPELHWKTVADTVVEMDAAEKAVIDAQALAAHNAGVEQRIKDAVDPTDPLAGIPWSVTTAALVITVNINTVVVNDQTTIVADPTDTKFVLVAYLHDTTADTLVVTVYERTTGLYADPAVNEAIVASLAEYSVVANGTTLTEV